MDEYFIWAAGGHVRFGFDPAHFIPTFSANGAPKPETKPPTQAMGYPPYHSRLIPRSGYIDGGIILTKGITVTRNVYEEAKAEEWNAFAEAVERMVNIEVDHLAPTETFKEGTILWIYDKVPTITTMEA